MGLKFCAIEIMAFHLLNLLLVLSLTLAGGATADEENPRPQPIVGDGIEWISPPPIKGLQFAWIQGRENEAGLYVLRVKLAAGARIPPHSHPDRRLSTVLSGTLFVGFGKEFDQNKLVAIESGNAYTAPANMPHFLWAKEGDVVYQETGLGPTATRIIKKN